MLKIGEVIEHNGRKIKCVEDVNHDGCTKCDLWDFPCNEFICSSFEREDKTDVIFIDVTEEK